MRFLGFIVTFLPVLSFAALPAPKGMDPLRPISEAPAAIRAAGEAVVRIRTIDGGTGTGFFVRPGNHLVTNAHVVGPENCSREGCYIDLDIAFEHGGKYTAKEVYAVPVLSIAENDLTVLDVYLPKGSSPTAEKFTPPATLEFSKQKDEAIVGQNLFLVGHAFGGLKRWSSAPAYERTGDWCKSTHACPPGNSGSPLMDHTGGIVGLVHRANDIGNELLDLQSVRHLSYFSLAGSFNRQISDKKAFKNTESLKAFPSIPMDGVIDLEKLEDGFEISTETLYVFAARRLFEISFKDGADTEELSIMETLQSGCQQELEDPESTNNPDFDYTICGLGVELIDCTPDQKDAAQCPTGKKRAKWLKLFTEVAEYMQLKNSDAFMDWYLAGPMAFAKSKDEAKKLGRETLVEHLGKHALPRLTVARQLAEVARSKADMTWNGTDYLQVLADYTKEPFYPQYFEETAYAVVSLSEAAFLGAEEVNAHFVRLLEDPKLPLSLKADLEGLALENSGKHKTKKTEQKKRVLYRRG